MMGEWAAACIFGECAETGEQQPTTDCGMGEPTCDRAAGEWTLEAGEWIDPNGEWTWLSSGESG